MATPTNDLANVLSVPRVAAPTAARREEVRDQGPWLFLAAPFSFVLVLLTVIYLARISF